VKHKENILRLKAEGKSYREIQEILGCSKGTIAYHLGPGQKEKTWNRSKDLRVANVAKIRKLKEESGCVDCGEMYPHYMLEFDHLPGHEKIGNPTWVARSRSWKSALLEMEKCDIVCANCHKIRTWQRYIDEI
jgi:hypothetical protein